MKITNRQKGFIHALIAELGWAREQYVQWLQHRFEVGSCTSLEANAAERAIDELRELIEANRAEFRATEAQIRFIKYLWLGVDYAACTEGDKLLNIFLRRRYNVENVEELSRKQASGAIAAIKRMQVNLQRKRGEVSVGRASIDTDTGKASAWVTMEDGSRMLIELTSNQIQ